MFENKARTGFHSDDADAFGASRAPDQHAPLRRGDDDLPDAANLHAANSDDPRDTKLRAVLRRMLDGDPHPVSGRRARMAADFQEARPATQLIDNIPSRHDANREQGHEPTSEPVPDLLEYVPDLLEGITELPQQPAAAPIVSEHAPLAGRWSFGIPTLGFILAAALAGAAIPTLLAPPPRYVSQAVLHAEGGGGARQAFLDIAAKRVVAPSVLSDIVARMKLDRDPEFTGTRAGALGVAVELLSGNGNASDAPSRAQTALRKAVAVDVDDQTGLLRLIVTTGDSARSADIANRLAVATLYDAAIAKAAGTSLGVETPVDRSRKELDRASAALAEFKARYGADKIAAAMALQQQRRQLDGQIKAADLAVETARGRLAAVKSATPAAVLSGALSGDLASAGLDDLRNRYSAAKAQLSQLSVQLGPRHPRLLAQQATVDDLAANMRSQLQRLAVSSEADLKTAAEKQAALAAQITATGQKSSDVDLSRLVQLQDAVAAAQGRYEAEQQSAALTAPEFKPPLTVLSQAIASAAPLDDHLASKQAIGFLAGLGLALCAVLLRKWLAGGEIAEDNVAGDSIMPVAPLLHADDGMSFPSWPDTASEPSVPFAPENGHRPDVADEWARIQQELADLRAKVETYAARRHHERG